MGLEASVMCSCLAEGRTTPPPFGERFIINDAGFPDLLSSNDAELERDMPALRDWLQSCCEHPNMEQTRVYVSNWNDYNAFVRALERVGEEHFPVLLRELPETNGGLTPAESAQKALGELAYFRSLDEVDRNIFVVNGETSERLYAYVPEHAGIFVWDGRHGHNIGVDHDGIFIEDVWELSRVVFRARRVEQVLLEPQLTEIGGDGHIRYTDVDSGRHFECKTAIPGKEVPWPDGRMRNDEGRFRLEYPRLIAVEEQPLHAAYFDYITVPLTEIFQAAAATGNPVRWE
jgi:hypothetical protein